MQILEHYDPLNLPRGSIRALVTLALLITLWSLVLTPGKDVPLVLTYLTLMVVGHYFGSRESAQRKSDPATAAKRPKSPLGLPAGTVRVVIVLGFAGVGYYHLRDRDPAAIDIEDRATAILCIVGAMLIGLLIRKFADVVSRGTPSAPIRWFENAKGVTVLVATALLVIGSVLGQDQPQMQNMTLVAAPVIGFYFGSRR